MQLNMMSAWVLALIGAFLVTLALLPKREMARPYILTVLLISLQGVVGSVMGPGALKAMLMVLTWVLLAHFAAKACSHLVSDLCDGKV